MSAIPDELVEKAWRAREATWPASPEDAMRAALEAVGLPALLERVEAAESEIDRLMTSREVIIGQRDDFAERVARARRVAHTDGGSCWNDDIRAALDGAPDGS